MAEKKLYECRYEIVYYAEAESVLDAQEYLRDVQHDDIFDTYSVDAREVKFRDHPIDGGWDMGSLVYGADGDKPLREVLSTLPENPKWKVR